MRAALSTALAGLILVTAGYGAAFVTFGAAAAIAAVVCFIALPETLDMSGVDTGKSALPVLPVPGLAAE